MLFILKTGNNLPLLMSLYGGRKLYKKEEENLKKEETIFMKRLPKYVNKAVVVNNSFTATYA